MQPSFDPRYFRSRAYLDDMLAALRRGRVARTYQQVNDHAFTALITIETRWSATEGYCRSYRSELGSGDALVHNPAYDRTEAHVAEGAVRRAVQTYRDSNGFRDLLAAEIVDDLGAAEARGDRAEARAHAARLVGPASPRLDAALDVVSRDVAAGQLAEVRPLADRLVALWARPGVTVFGLLLRDLHAPVPEAAHASIVRVEAWLAALAALYPDRGEFPYWRAAALELLGRRAEALAAYTRARAMGRLKDFHSAEDPAFLDPQEGRRALRALQKVYGAAR